MKHQGRILQEQTEKMGYSVSDLTEKTGKTPQNFTHIFKQETIRRSTLVKYCEVLKIDIGLFFDREGSKGKENTHNEGIAPLKEILGLKEMIEVLNQRIQDKDVIIAMLKEKKTTSIPTSIFDPKPVI